MYLSWVSSINDYWWRQMSLRNKILVIVFLLVILVIIVGTIIFVFLAKSNPPIGVCLNFSCGNEASKLSRYIDESIDPCDDFFMFSCNNFHEHAYLDEKLSFKNLEMLDLLDMYKEPVQIKDHTMVKMSKKFFHVCSNTTGLESETFTTIKKVLKSVGGWPLLEGDKWDENNFDWLNLIYKLRNMGLYYSFFMGLEVVPDLADEMEQTYMLKVFLDDMPDYSDDIKFMAIKLGALNDSNLTGELDKMHEFFAKFKTDKPQFVKEPSTYRIKEVQEKSPSINWLEYINNVLGQGVKMDRDDSLLFPSFQAMSARLEIIKKTPKRVLANYMMWKLVENITSFFNKQKRNVYDSKKELQMREEFCLETIENMYLLSPMEIMWMEKHTTRTNSKKLEDFLYALKEEIIQKINSIAWSTKEEKQTVLEKARNVLINIGIPANYTADKLMDELQVDMIEPESETLLDLYAQQNRNRITTEFHQIKMAKSDKFFWKWERANMLRPFYLEHESEILLPSVVFNAFRFHEDLPNYLNYGIMGAIIGKQYSEILLSIDAGIEFVKKLNDGLDEKFVNAHLDDQQTRDLYQQVIAEQLSYSAYQKWVLHHGEEPRLLNFNYTQNQLFWISAASTFCYLVYLEPPLTTEFRWGPKHVSVLITGSMRYNTDFVNDFHCKS